MTVRAAKLGVDETPQAARDARRANQGAAATPPAATRGASPPRGAARCHKHRSGRNNTGGGTREGPHKTPSTRRTKDDHSLPSSYIVRDMHAAWTSSGKPSVFSASNEASVGIRPSDRARFTAFRTRR